MQDPIGGAQLFGFLTQRGNNVYLTFTIEILPPDFYSENYAIPNYYWDSSSTIVNSYF